MEEEHDGRLDCTPNGRVYTGKRAQTFATKEAITQTGDRMYYKARRLHSKEP